MKLPRPRGAVSAALIGILNGNGDSWPERVEPDDDVDLQLSLFVCYELHYRGWDGVDDRWEWNPGLLRFRAVAEERLQAALRALAGEPTPVEPGGVPAALVAAIQADDAPSVSGYLRGRATY